MKFIDSDTTRYDARYVSSDGKLYLDVEVYNPGYSGGAVWMHLIKEDNVVWRQDGWPKISEEAKQYFQKMVSLRAFS